jgi:hypothetical protein
MATQKNTPMLTWKTFVPLLIIAFVLLGQFLQSIRQDRALKQFQTRNAATVHRVNIYPGVSAPVGSPVIFRRPHGSSKK